MVNRLARGGMLTVMQAFWSQLAEHGSVEILAHGPNSAAVTYPARVVGGRFSGFLRFPAVWVYVLRVGLACWRGARAGSTVLLPQDSWATGAAAGLAGWLSGAPVVVMEHGTASALGTSFYWKRRFPPIGLRDRLTRPMLVWSIGLLHRLCLALMDAALLPSDEAEAIYISRGVPRSKLLRYHVPVDVERFRPADESERRALRRRAGLPEDGLIVGTVGRLAPEKTVEMLIDAVAELSPATRPVVVIAGEGRTRRELEKHAATTGIEARFLGDVPDDVLLAVLRSIDVFAYTSSQGSNVPNATLEAMACGLAVIATDAPVAHRAMLADGRGTAIGSGDRTALVTALSRYLADRPLRQRAGVAAREWVVKHHAPAVLEREIDDFTMWLDAHPKRRTRMRLGAREG